MALPVQIGIANDTFSRFFSCSFTNMKKGVRKIAAAVPFLLLFFFPKKKNGSYFCLLFGYILLCSIQSYYGNLATMKTEQSNIC